MFILYKCRNLFEYVYNCSSECFLKLIIIVRHSFNHNFTERYKYFTFRLMSNIYICNTLFFFLMKIKNCVSHHLNSCRRQKLVKLLIIEQNITNTAKFSNCNEMENMLFLNKCYSCLFISFLRFVQFNSAPPSSRKGKNVLLPHKSII
jgi:hypothetical protein